MTDPHKLRHKILGAATFCACIIAFELFMGGFLPLYVTAGFERAIRTPAVFILLPYALMSNQPVSSATIFYTALVIWAVIGGLIGQALSREKRERAPVRSWGRRLMRSLETGVVGMAIATLIVATVDAFILDWSTGISFAGGLFGRPGLEGLGGPTLSTISCYSGIRFPPSVKLRESSIVAWQHTDITAILVMDLSDLDRLEATKPTDGQFTYKASYEGPNRVMIRLNWHN